MAGTAFESLPSVPEDAPAETNYLSDSFFKEAPASGPPPGTRGQAGVVNRFRASDLAARGIPSFRNASGDVTQVNDESGGPLSGLKGNIAYDWMGQPKQIDYGETGVPSVSDPFAKLPATTDTKTGAIEKYGPGGLYQYVGQDPKATAAAAQKAGDAELSKESALLQRKVTLDEHDLVQGTKDRKALRGELTTAVPGLDDPKLAGADADTVHKAIDTQFDSEYARPEANATSGWFGGGDLSPEAKALRADIDARKADAHDKADQLFGLNNKLSGLKDSVTQGRAQERGAVQTLLDHTQGRDTGAVTPLAAGPAPGLYPPQEDWSRILGRAGQEAPTQPDGSAALITKPEVALKVAQALPPSAQNALTIPPAGADGKAQSEGFWATLGRAFGSKIIPAVGTALGGIGAAIGGAFTGVSETGIGAVALDIAGGAAAGTATAALQRKLMGETWAKQNEAQMDTNAKEHPVAAQIGTMVPFLVSIFGGGGALVKAAGGQVVGKAATGAGRNAILTALETGAKYKAPLVERVAANAAMFARAGASEGAQEKYVEGKDVSVVDATARAAALGGAIGLFPAAKTLLGSVLGKSVTDGAAMALAGNLYDTGIHGKPFDMNEVVKEAKGDIPSFAVQNLLLGLLHKGMPAARPAAGAPGGAPPEGGGPADPTPRPPTLVERLNLIDIRLNQMNGDKTSDHAMEKELLDKEKTQIVTEATAPETRATPSGEAIPERQLDLTNIKDAETALVRAHGDEGLGKLRALRKTIPDPADRLQAINNHLVELQAKPEGGKPSEPTAEPKGPAKGPSAPEPADKEGAKPQPSDANAPVTEAPVAEAPATDAELKTVDVAAHEAATSPKNDLPEPTQAQKEAGNYQKGHVVVGGLDVSIENPAGTKRKPEYAPLQSHYGYIKGTVGADKDHVDVFIKQGTPKDWSGPVFVVNQHNADGGFDEHKAVIGIKTLAEAKGEYQRNYQKGWSGGKSVVQFENPAQFKKWAESGAKGQPVRDPALQAKLAKKKEVKEDAGREPSKQEGAVAKGSAETQPAKQGSGGLASARTAEASFVPETRDTPIRTVDEAKSGIAASKKFHAAESIPHVERATGRSGIATERDGSAIITHYPEIVESAGTVEANGGDSQKWLRDGHGEEIKWHIPDLLVSGGRFEAIHRDIWDLLQPSARAAFDRVYPGTSSIVHKGAEYLRMVGQYRDMGHITESNWMNTSEIEQILKGKQSDLLERQLKSIAALETKEAPVETKPAKPGTPQVPAMEGMTPLGAKQTKLQKRASELTHRVSGIAGRSGAENAVVMTLIRSGTGKALDQAESKIAKLEEKYATTTGKQPSGEKGELPRVPPRTDVPADETQIRKGEGAKTDAGGGPVERPPAPAEQKPSVGQSGLLDAKGNKALDDAVEGLFAGKPGQPIRPGSEWVHPEPTTDEDFANIVAAHKVGVEAGLRLPPEAAADVQREYDALTKEMIAAAAPDSPQHSRLKALMGKHTFLGGKLEGVRLEGPNYDKYLADMAPGGEQFEELRSELEDATGEKYSDAAVQEHIDAAGGPETFGAGKPMEQEAIPGEKLAGVIAAAQEMARQGIDTPEKLAKLLEEKFAGKARPYSQGFWDALGIVRPDLRGAHDWAAIYAPVKKEEEKAGAIKPQNAAQLTQAVAQRLLARKVVSRTDLTELAKESGLSVKDVDEAAELGIVQAARGIAQGYKPAGMNETEFVEHRFDDMVQLYEDQPNLTAKTSTSKVNQALSTPAPLAYAAGILAGLPKAKSAYEPTAGNGMLTIAGDPKIFHVNELNPDRVANLEKQGFGVVTTLNALAMTLPTEVQAIVENPPFGTILGDDQKSKEFPLAGTGETTTSIDHAIALHTLQFLAPDGRAVLLVGGKNIMDPEERAKAYATPNQMKFWKPLYGKYQVIDHLTIAGDLYKKMGAGWPVDMVVIAGVGKSAIQLPSADGPRILNSWDDLRNELTRTDAQRIEAGRYDPERDREKIGGVFDSIRRVAGSEPRVGPEDDTKRVEARDERGGGEPSPLPSDLRPPEPLAEPAGGDVSGPAREGLVGPGRSDVESEQRGSLGFRVPYKPANSLPSFAVFVPTNLEAPIRDSLERLKERVGPLDQWVRQKLGYRADAPLERYFSAEQIDAMAQAIDAIESQVAAVNGDQGGIGKGRAAAGLMAYAKEQGKTPIFVTKDVKLYAAMIEDLHDIGRDDIIPMFTDNGISFVDYADKKWEQGKMGETMDEIARTGKLPEGTHALFTTYSQIQTDQPKGYKAEKAERASMKRAHQPPPDGSRMTALRKLAPGSIIIADESHLASGDSIRAWRLSPLLAAAHGTAYSSATFAKRPDSMGIYSQTSLSHATQSMDDLVEAMKQGGVPLQQVVSATLASDGLYMRRERDFSKAVFKTHVNLDTKDRDTHLADNYTYGLRTILGISNKMKDAAANLNKILRRTGKDMRLEKEPRLESTNFAAKIHNLVSQYLFAIKAESVVRRTVEGVTKGFTNAEGKTMPHKVIITFQNTMEQPMLDLEHGGRALTFNGMLLRYLDSQRVLKSGTGTAQQTITITDTPDPEFAGMSDRQLQEHMIVPHPTDPEAEAGVNEKAVAELFRRAMAGIFEEAEAKLEGIELADMPVSPIDHIKQALSKAGIKNAEITGRSIGIDEDGALYKIHPSTHTKKAHLRTLSAFNNSDTDVLLMNASGSTGISAHSSTKFKQTLLQGVLDHHPRAMLVAQLNLDINDQIQTFYRTDRTGQKYQPYYELIQTALPAELRPAAMFQCKMANLNANTTSNAENEISEGNKGIDIFNQYGDEVVYNYLKSDPAFTEMLEMPGIMDGEVLAPIADILADLEDGVFTGKVTGRTAVLPTQEGEVFWEKVMADYVAKIAYQNELGENELIAEAIDIRAETLDSKELTPAKTGAGRASGFDAPSYMEKIKADIGMMPLSAKEVIAMMEPLGTQAYDIMKKWEAAADAWQEKRLAELAEKALGWTEEKAAQYKARWREQAEEINAALDLIGMGLHLQSKKGLDGYGAITAVHLDEEHPLTPSKQIFDVHVNTTKKKMRIAASELPSIARMAVGDFEQVYEGTAERSNERYMITGNLLAAYLAIRDHAPNAKIVQYTTEKSDVRQGILMPNKFTPGQLAAKRLVESPSHMRQLLDAGRSLTNGDGSVTIVKPRAEYVLRVPSNKIMGGAYWRDSQLAGLMDGNQFIERGGAMIGKFSAEAMPLVYQRLLDLNTSLFYTEQGDAPLGAGKPHKAPMAFYENDVVSVAKSIGLGVKESLEMLQHIVAPAAGVQMEARDQAMKMLGTRYQQAYQTDQVLEGWRNAMEKIPRPQQTAFIDRMKLGEQQPTPELQQLADTMRKIDTESWEAAQAAYMALGFKEKEVPLAWLENHYRVLWKKIPGSTEEEKSAWIGKARRGLRGSMGQHKQHTLETMSEGIEMGGVPYSYNPVTMFQLAQADLWKLTSTLHAWKWAKDNHFVEYVKKPFPKAPDGMVALDDTIAKRYFPASSGEGLVAAGQYFVEEGFGRLLNNYLSTDHIRAAKMGRGLIWLKNATTQLELALSPFHAVFETLEAVGSNIGLGLQKLVNRGLLGGSAQAALEGLRDMVTAAGTPVTHGLGKRSLGAQIRVAAGNPDAFFKSAEGKKMLKNYPRAREMIDDLFSAGWKPTELEQDWRNKSVTTFMDAVSDIKAGASDNYIGAGLRAFPAANEMLMKPLFDYYIPNLKVAQFFKEYAEALKENESKLKGGVLTRAALARQVWRFVEDRFGELNYDTLFWNQTFKSAMQLMFRSVTWKLGSISAFGGAMGGQAKEFRDAFKERRAPQLHRNMAWLFGLFLLTATLGYIMSKVLAGKEPKNLSDLIFPQIDPRDDKVRVSLPTYAKDLGHLIRSPSNYLIASLAGWIGRVADLLRNKDYYGVQIRNTDDNIVKQALQVGAFTGTAMLPFSIRGYKNLSAHEVGALRKSLSLLGVQPAPRYISQTPAEQASESYWQGQKTEAGISPAKYETQAAKRHIVSQIRHGEQPDISKALSTGTIKARDIKPIYQRAQMGALASQVLHMPLEDAERIYQRANLQERRQLSAIMTKKRANSAARNRPAFSGF